MYFDPCAHWPALSLSQVVGHGLLFAETFYSLVSQVGVDEIDVKRWCVEESKDKITQDNG